VIVVDGGSGDATFDLAKPLSDKAIRAPRGRAAQMNAGAKAASGDMLLFLHADTRLPEHADAALVEALAGSDKRWGRFDVRIDGGAPLGIVAAMMNLRSRVTGIATGDQAIFVTRALFDRAGGFPEIALMEDVALSKRLRRDSRPLCLRARVTTSDRRWQTHGVLRTIVLMWRLRLAYYFGAEPASLAKRYGYGARG
jgi:rSAM/selenodomain-associated transferase 2